MTSPDTSPALAGAASATGTPGATTAPTGAAAAAPTGAGPVEVAWFSALCDDDYELLGVPDPSLRSSFGHCRDIVVAAERQGFDAVLLPSGYQLGIDATAFAAGIAPLTERIRLLLAVRCGEVVVPQLARQLATIDQMSSGRLAINLISSDLPGESIASSTRYQRTLEVAGALRALLDGEAIDVHGDFVDCTVDPPDARTASGRCPPLYFGGLSEPARAVAAQVADVYLMWPDVMAEVTAVVDDLRRRSSSVGRPLKIGYRVHVIVRETSALAHEAARRLVSALDEPTGEAIVGRSLDATSVGVQRQRDLRGAADGDGYVEEHLWTGIGRARSGCGAAIVGDPDEVLGKLLEYRAAGIDAFILSGYPHLAECELVGEHVLGRLEHAPLRIAVR